MKKYILIASFVLLFGFAAITHANPSYFPPTVQTAAATTSASALTPGTGTTTLILDSYYVNSLNNTTKTDSAVLLTQFAGLSGAANLGISVEYANDYSGVNCATVPTGCDWYRDNILGVNGISTTSQTANLNNFNTYSWTFASSTVAGGAVSAASGATSTKAIQIATPTRFTRIVYTITGAAGWVWGQISPVKERSETR